MVLNVCSLLFDMDLYELSPSYVKIHNTLGQSVIMCYVV